RTSYGTCRLLDWPPVGFRLRFPSAVGMHRRSNSPGSRVLAGEFSAGRWACGVQACARTSVPTGTMLRVPRVRGLTPGSADPFLGGVRMHRWLSLVAVALLVGCEAKTASYSNSSGTLALSRDDALLYAVDTDNEVLAVVDTAKEEKIA